MGYHDPNFYEVLGKGGTQIIIVNITQGKHIRQLHLH